MQIPWNVTWKAREAAGLFWDKVNGRISQRELEEGVRNLVGPEPELPLGIGAATEGPGMGLPHRVG